VALLPPKENPPVEVTGGLLVLSLDDWPNEKVPDVDAGVEVGGCVVPGTNAAFDESAVLPPPNENPPIEEAGGLLILSLDD
jgi:hypothetical protein